MSHAQQQDPQAVLRQELMKQDKEQLVEMFLQADIQVREWITQAQQAVKVREDALISRESDLDAKADQAVNAVIQHQHFALDPELRFEVRRNSEVWFNYYREYKIQKSTFEAKQERFEGQKNKCEKSLKKYRKIEAEFADAMVMMDARLAVLEEARSTLLHQQERDRMIMEAQEQERALQEQIRALRAEKRCPPSLPTNQAPRIALRPPQRLLMASGVPIQQQALKAQNKAKRTSQPISRAVNNAPRIAPMSPQPVRTKTMAPPSFHVQQHIQPAPRLALTAPHTQDNNNNNNNDYDNVDDMIDIRNGIDNINMSDDEDD